jgi:tetratricopeptide (TPR) repeat protein
MADVFEIQDDIVASIVKALAPALLGEAMPAGTRPTDSLQVYELYLKGRQYRHSSSPTLIPLAIRSFEQAIALDSGYTLAYAGLADCHTSLRFTCLLSDAMSRPRAEAPITCAMALDPMLPEVQVSQGLFILIFERAWRQAEPHFRRAIELNPRWSLAHLAYGFFFGIARQQEEALTHVTVALDRDPLSPYVHVVAALTLVLCRAYRDAERLARQALELQPDYYFGLHVLAVVLSFADRAAEAIPFAERLVALSSRLPIYLGLLGAVYGAAGRTADLVRLEHELEERRRLGEYITPVIRFQFAYGRRDRGLITRALEDCLADNTPFASLWSVRRSLDAWRTEDPAIDELLLRLGDDVR